MEEFTPHPLVTAVALGLADMLGGAVKTEAEKLKDTHGGRQSGGGEAAEDAKDTNALATAFADQANLPGLTLIAGLLGGPCEREHTTWRLVYLDSELSDWLLVDEKAIVKWQRIKDVNAPLGVRDVMWLNAMATVISGSGPQTNQGRFLVGELTRAGDFAPSTSGGTFSAASGLLCEAQTPGCCRVTRTRCPSK